MDRGAYVILIFDRRGDVSGGGIGDAPSFVMAPGSDGVTTRFSDGMRKVTFKIKAGRLRTEAEIPNRQENYFWVANACSQFPDWAPDASNGGPAIRAHGFRR